MLTPTSLGIMQEANGVNNNDKAAVGSFDKKLNERQEAKMMRKKSSSLGPFKHALGVTNETLGKGDFLSQTVSQTSQIAVNMAK